ncbi:uncharacterized protein LOC135848369 [Planococcus citri]|uniref:uncharacterized protein LOC135848369 n=1 Tax=Planococcus citri TaxID=170843 RepID=UPI0031F88955
MRFLKRAFIGEAEQILRHFGLKEATYPEAWDYVMKRFNNPRAIIRAHFRNLHCLESIKNEQGIRSLLDKINVTLRGLKAVGLEIDDTFSQYIAYLVGTCLDPVTLKDWENSFKTTKRYPSFDELEDFLQIRSFSVEDRSSENNSKKQKSHMDKTTDRGKSRNEKKSFVAGKITCVVCSQSHFLNNCKDFMAKTPKERYNVVKKNDLCLNCFNPFHSTDKCTRPTCGTCSRKHNTLLHWTPATTVQQNQNGNGGEKPDPQSGSGTPKSSFSATLTVQNKSVLLPSAVVKANINQQTVLARVLLDNCSQVNLVAKPFIKTNNIRTRKSGEVTSLGGIVEGVEILDTVADIVLQSRFSDFKLPISAEVVAKIPYRVNFSAVLNLPGEYANLPLAECKLPHSNVDIILGAEHYEYVMKNHRYFCEKLSLRETEFGFVVSGINNSSAISPNVYCGLTQVDIDSQLKKFWQTEELNDSYVSHKDDVCLEYKLIEEHFEKTHTRAEDGRFIVRLPTKPTIDVLNGSYSKALAMLKRSEKHTPKDIRKEYVNFMTEYEQLGHMRKLSASEAQLAKYFIPHQMVCKPTSTTTKYCVVFNASSIDLSGTSLNDHLMIGPTLQPELFDNMVRFRFFIIAFCADIEKMYRQMFVKPEDRKYQCILWRKDENEPVSVCELCTITYGTKPAAYIATRCLREVAKNLKERNPRAAKSIEDDFYIDDYTTGDDTVEGALELQNAVHQELKNYGFPLRKYQSNSEEFLSKLDSSLVEPLTSRSFGDRDSVNVLGLNWCTKNDTLCVVLNLNPLPDSITKRILLSDIARVFDVLGVLSPITVRAKIILQDLWRESLKWDDKLSDHLQDKFLKYRRELSQLKKYSVPRLCVQFKMRIELIGFCDASPKAYCAVVYIRCVDKCGNVKVNFVCSKTKVAPLKPVLTIPRLELQAALLLAKLMIRVKNNLNIDSNNLYAFSDSMIVLSWLKLPLNALKTFVSNRVEKILDHVGRWMYVDTASNPADLATRGLNVTEFMERKNLLWLKGPVWLENNFNEHLNSDVKISDNIELLEMRVPKIAFVCCSIEASTLSSFSSYLKAIHAVSYMFRWVDKKRGILHQGELTTEENIRSLDALIKYSQNMFLGKDLARLANGQNLKKDSSLRSLDPFIDDKGILRVGGRLKNAQLPFDKRHPIILSAKCNLVNLLVDYVHEKYFHCSRVVVYSYIQNQYWIVGGVNNAIKKVIRECVLCRRLPAVTGKQIMGQLPSTRITPARPFLNVGIDLCGPFTVRCLGHRSLKHNKVYAAFFVCMCTRAVHIELVSDLSTDVFLKAFRRFAARRGLPSQVYSDNGKNFVGANNILKEQYKIQQYAANEQIKWQFITPRAPHQGGLWEAAIKSGKSLIVKACKNHVLNMEDLHTVTCQVESILNSRPLCYQKETLADERLV